MARDHLTWGCGNSIIGRPFVSHVSCSTRGMERRRDMARERNNSNGVSGVLYSLGAYWNCLRRSRAKARSAFRSKTRAASPRRARDVWVGTPGTRRRRRISASIVYPFSLFLGVEGGGNRIVCSMKRLKGGSEQMALEERKGASRVVLCSLDDGERRSEAKRGTGAQTRRGRHVTRDTLSFSPCDRPLRSLFFVKNHPFVFTFAPDDA